MAYKSLLANGIYEFQSDNSGNLSFNYGTEFIFGLRSLSDTLIQGHLEVSGYQKEVRASGDVIAFYSSDRRLKDNIVDIKNPIDKIKQLRGVEFDWNDKAPDWTRHPKFGLTNGTHDVGVIAQEVQKVLPEAVKQRDEGGYLAVDYKRIIPLLIEGMKEQHSRIEELEKRLGE